MFFAQPKKTAVRKVSVPVKTTKVATPPPAVLSRTQSPALSDGKRRRLTPSTLARVASASRGHEKSPKRLALDRSSPGRKRKPASPASFTFVSDNEESDEEQHSTYQSDAMSPRKRKRTDGSEEPDQRRVLGDKTDWSAEKADFIHAVKLTKGNKRQYYNPYLQDEEPVEVELAWPSGAPRER